jgi:FtsH-binding integral membrane protein
MSYAQEPYRAGLGDYAAMAAADERSAFITKTYLTLAGAIGVFVGLETAILTTGLGDTIFGMLRAVAGQSAIGALIVILGFLGVSWLASAWAQSAVSPALQYAGLGLYTVVEAIFFAPILLIANAKDPNIIPSAAITTLVLFGGLTLTVFVTRKDFSFMRSLLVFGSIALVGFLLFVVFVSHQSLGPIFFYAAIALACGYILYDTSNVLHHYRIGQHVAAALALFASVAMLFYYIVRLYMSRRD